MATAYGLSFWTSSIALESELSRNLEAQHGLVPKLSHHGGKNSARCAKKPSYMMRSLFFSETMFLPRMMFVVAKQRVVLSGLELRARSQAQSHDSNTGARRAETSAEGF